MAALDLVQHAAPHRHRRQGRPFNFAKGALRGATPPNRRAESARLLAEWRPQRRAARIGFSVKLAPCAAPLFRNFALQPAGIAGRANLAFRIFPQSAAVFCNRQHNRSPWRKGDCAIPVTTLKAVRPLVFWPPAIILVAALSASLIDFDGFLAAASAANAWILARFGWLFSLASFGAVLLMAAVFVSPLGRVRIGGAEAVPILKRWNWFAITLCTTIATGILFWGTAEPLFHLNGPPGFAGAEERSGDAATFALSTLYMHWAVTPYSIYAVPALAFALAYYNLGTSYSLSGPLSVAFGDAARGAGGAIIDALALLALVAGVAASLGAGVMTLSGGIASETGFSSGAATRLFVTVLIVAVYVGSSVSGLQRGIKWLSDINIRFFFLLVAFVFIAGPTLAIAKLGAVSVFEYAREFLPRSLNFGFGDDAAWTRDWTIFYFANWLAWAPITALFLGRIAYGYTVREFVLFSLVFPALFGMAWMTIFGGAAIRLDLTGGGALTAALENDGPEAVMYVLLDALPLTSLFVFTFIFTTFVSFVTAMDSNTHSIASVCLKAKRQEDEVRNAGLWIKIFWGVLIGAVAWIMTSTNGIDGVRMLSNLGGGPGLVILLGCGVVLARFMAMGPDRLSAPPRSVPAADRDRLHNRPQTPTGSGPGFRDGPA